MFSTLSIIEHPHRDLSKVHENIKTKIKPHDKSMNSAILPIQDFTGLERLREFISIGSLSRTHTGYTDISGHHSWQIVALRG